MSLTRPNMTLMILHTNYLVKLSVAVLLDLRTGLHYLSCPENLSLNETFIVSLIRESVQMGWMLSCFLVSQNLFDFIFGAIQLYLLLKSSINTILIELIMKNFSFFNLWDHQAGCQLLQKELFCNQNYSVTININNYTLQSKNTSGCMVMWEAC